MTSAIAVPAYAGIPLTHRDHASLVTIATGHQAWTPGDGEPGVPVLPWELLARHGGTLVFLMAVRQLGGVLAALVAARSRPDHPGGDHRAGYTRQPAHDRRHGRDARRGGACGRRDTTGGRAWWGRSSGCGIACAGSRTGRCSAGASSSRDRASRRASCRACSRSGRGGAVVPDHRDRAAGRSGAARTRRRRSGRLRLDRLHELERGAHLLRRRSRQLGRDVRELAGVRLAAIGPETAAELGRHLLRPARRPAGIPRRRAARRARLPRTCGDGASCCRAPPGRAPILPDTLARARRDRRRGDRLPGRDAGRCRCRRAVRGADGWSRRRGHVHQQLDGAAFRRAGRRRRGPAHSGRAGRRLHRARDGRDGARGGHVGDGLSRRLHGAGPRSRAGRSIFAMPRAIA